MRLGTKSCSECRRRKVRCKQDPAASLGRCHQCVLHGTVCKPQERDCQNEAAPEPVSRTPPRNNDTPESECAPASHSTAPLLRFFGQALSFSSPSSPQPHPQYPRNVVVVSPAVRDLLPPPNTLRLISRLTWPFWSVWPLASSLHEFPTTVDQASEFVDSHLLQPSSTTPGRAAKCLTWLAACLQQLPKDVSGVSTLDARQMVELFLAEADGIIRKSSSFQAPEEAEALALQYKCFVNMGKPRRAWQATRAGLDRAVLLGLHRSQPCTVPPQRARSLWATLWRQDRQSAVFLGLPYSVPNHFLNDEIENAETPLAERVLGRLNWVASRITERDQAADPEPSYSTTVSIMEEMENLASMIPNEAWQLQASNESECAQLGLPFWGRAALFFFHYINTLLHLPHILQARTSKKYAYSREAALNSAEKMLEIFAQFPTSGGLPVVCDYLDYAAFSGAMILATDLVSQPYNAESRCQLQSADEKEERECRLWHLILGFVETMKQKEALVACSVAGQAAQVLGHIHAARHGNYTGPDDHVFVIPYFGKIRFRVTPVLTAIELNTAAFSVRSPQCGMSITPLELGEDWASQDCSYMDTSWDWSAVFNLDHL